MDWERIKERLWSWYAKIAQFLIFQQIVLYLIGCIAAGQPLGLADYAAFLYRVFTFK